MCFFKQVVAHSHDYKAKLIISHTHNIHDNIIKKYT